MFLEELFYLNVYIAQCITPMHEILMEGLTVEQGIEN